MAMDDIGTELLTGRSIRIRNLGRQPVKYHFFIFLIFSDCSRISLASAQIELAPVLASAYLDLGAAGLVARQALGALGVTARRAHRTANRFCPSAVVACARKALALQTLRPRPAKMGPPRAGPEAR